MTQNHAKTDHQIQSAVVKELDWSAGVESEHIGVSATDGAVTLSGEVATLPERDAAIEAAIRVHSVIALVDEIVVKRHDGGQNDADIARAATEVLSHQVQLAGAAVNATVHDHTITLTGIRRLELPARSSTHRRRIVVRSRRGRQPHSAEGNCIAARCGGNDSRRTCPQRPAKCGACRPDGAGAPGNAQGACRTPGRNVAKRSSRCGPPGGSPMSTTTWSWRHDIPRRRARHGCAAPGCGAGHLRAVGAQHPAVEFPAPRR